MRGLKCIFKLNYRILLMALLGGVSNEPLKNLWRNFQGFSSKIGIWKTIHSNFSKDLKSTDQGFANIDLHKFSKKKSRFVQTPEIAFADRNVRPS